jgi:hypothetical protein
MDIGSTHGVGGLGGIQGPQKLQRAAEAAYAARSGAADRVDLSGPGQLLSRALALPAVRMDRVNEVKALMESGKFDTDARLEAALQRFALENPDVLE